MRVDFVFPNEFMKLKDGIVVLGIMAFQGSENKNILVAVDKETLSVIFLKISENKDGEGLSLTPLSDAEADKMLDVFLGGLENMFRNYAGTIPPDEMIELEGINNETTH